MNKYARMRMMIFLTTLAFASGCATIDKPQRKPAFVVSFNVSVESHLDPTTTAKAVVVIKTQTAKDDK